MVCFPEATFRVDAVDRCEAIEVGCLCDRLSYIHNSLAALGTAVAKPSCDAPLQYVCNGASVTNGYVPNFLSFEEVEALVYFLGDSVLVGGPVQIIGDIYAKEEFSKYIQS